MKLREVILNERNKAVTPQSISMWFKRHLDILRKLKTEVKEEELSSEVVSETLFKNGTFRKIPCIEKWILQLRGRGAKEYSINSFVGAIKQVCIGRLPADLKKGQRKGYGAIIEDWCTKHPRRLTLEDALKYISEMKQRKLPTRNHRLALRNFLKSRNVEGCEEISGKLENGAGQYAHLYISREKVYAIFDYLKRLNREAYEASFFSYKTASRRTATLNAHSKFINFEDHTIRVTEKASRGLPKRIQEKCIPKDLWQELNLDNRKGKLFDIEPNELNALLRRAYKEIIPELADDIPMPFHFWRHQFAQHALRKTGWNYGLVASLGHWTVETLERYYGKMDRKTALESGREHLPEI